MTVRYLCLAMAAPITLGACTTTNPAPSDDISAMLRMMSQGQSRVSGADLVAAIEEASQYPLGSAKNPVRAQMPPGQRAYLARLRCSDGNAPSFFRVGNVGVGVYGNIVDDYTVTCEAGATPEKTTVYMDMYHRGHVEKEPVPGFTIVGK